MLKAKYGWELSVDGIVADQDIFNHILKTGASMMQTIFLTWEKKVYIIRFY